MNAPVFDKTAIETARDRLTILFDAFSAATGVPRTIVAQIAIGDKAFLSRYLKGGFNFGTYDTVTGRLSALWPEGAQWPAEVPRPSPVEVPADLLAVFEERMRSNSDEKDASDGEAVEA